MKNLESLKSSKFEVLSQDKLAGLIGGLVDNRTRTVTPVFDTFSAGLF